MDTSPNINPKLLLQQLPKRYGYASKIIQKLQQKGIAITQATIYHTIAGKSHNIEVINALMDIVEEYKTSQNSLNERYKSMQVL